MCKFGAVMFKKNLLKISIIFICLFAVANHLFYINTNMVDASIPSKEFSKETMPDEVRPVGSKDAMTLEEMMDDLQLRFMDKRNGKN